MRAAVGLSTDFLALIESLASLGEVREVGALRDVLAGHGRSVARKIRAVAQLGRALRSGRRGRGFKSHQPDSFRLFLTTRNWSAHSRFGQLQ